MDEITLKLSGGRRVLPSGLFGFNSPITFALPGDDPRTIDLTRDLQPGLLRFPGGTVSNFFDWRTGHLAVPIDSQESKYRKQIRGLGEVIRHRHPAPYSLEAFSRVATGVGAEIILVPNLETSTIEDQRDWLAHAARHRVVPRRIEMGNEFYLAMMEDPESLRRFPDWATTTRLTREYLDAISPHLQRDSLIALQSASSRFYVTADPGTGLVSRLWAWDEQMAPEPWFHAVTAHLYPEFDLIGGKGASARVPENIGSLYPALMARADEGIDRVLRFLEAKMPGKEIWITEWGAWPLSIGGWLQPGPLPDLPSHPAFAPFQALWIQYVARALLSILRHASVTAVLYHAISFAGGVWGLYDLDPTEGAYSPIGSCRLLRWFYRAANDGAEYVPVIAEGARLRRGGGALAGESYADIDAAMFRRSSETVLIAHNATDETKLINLSQCQDGTVPDELEIMHTPDLMEIFDRSLPPSFGCEPSIAVEMPAYSIVRASWTR